MCREPTFAQHGDHNVIWPYWFGVPAVSTNALQGREMLFGFGEIALHLNFPVQTT
jgi:hypothetical protein